jgi:DNA polymerase III subunit epsilon
MIVKFFYDLETTGTDERKHSIHQIYGMFEVDGEIVEKINIKVAPHPKAKVEPEALTICKVTEEQIRGYEDMKSVYIKFVALLKKYCDRYNAKDKIWLVGFNNRKFDDVFLRCWFEQNGDSFFGSWFWTGSLDVMILASQYLIDRRSEMPSFKLKRVAKELGILVDANKLHDAEYDILLTRQVYRIVTGLDFDISKLL